MKIFILNLFKSLGLLTISFITISCNSELKVSVFETLPTENVQKITQQDSSFLPNYNYIRTLADSVFISVKVSPQFSSLEYVSLFEFEKKNEDEFQRLKDSESVGKKWFETFGRDLEKFKSDLIKFKNHILENDYHNFLEIDVLKVSELESFVSRYTNVELLIRPKNGVGIRKVSGRVYFLPKTEKFDSLETYLNRLDRGAYFSYSGYKKSEFKDNAMDTQRNLSELEDLPIELIKEKFNIHFSISELVTDDKFVDSSFEEVPREMIQVIKGEFSFYEETYITKYINSNFKNLNQFISDSAFQNVKSIYPLEAQFFEIGAQKYSEIQEAKYKKESEERRRALGLD